MTKVLLTDSMKTIQKKLNSDKDITFQTGTYKITSQLVIPSNVSINLNGSTLRRCASIQSIFINKVSNSTTKYNGAGNIKIFNGTLEAMSKYQPDNLLTFFHSHDIEIHNMTFLDNLCHDIEINSCKNVKVYDCEFLGYNSSELFREMIQIDSAYATGLFISGSTIKSKCYDGTMCENINITNCTFTKSKNRDYPTACIGTHTQLINGRYHNNISIYNNRFTCRCEQHCLSIIGMKNVTIKNNEFVNCGRIARIYSKEYSYNLQGNKVTPKQNDGVCEYIEFTNNIECGYTGDNKCSGIYVNSIYATKIKIDSNEFIKNPDNPNEKYYLYIKECKQPKDIIAINNKTKLKVGGK